VEDELPPHAVHLFVTDDLVRSRPTVIFRLVLVIPAWIVLAFWSIGAVFVVIAAWFVLLVRGRCSRRIHEFLAAYVRYTIQVSAYLHLVANPYPGFGPKDDYPVRVDIDEPVDQRRLSVLFRLFLALPSLLLAGATGGSAGFTIPRQRGRYGFGSGATGLGGIASVLGWFAIVARGVMPSGLRDLGTYSVGYTAQTYAYLLLLTDRYPSTDPRLAGPQQLPHHPVRVEVTDDLERPRLLVAFRLLLALPHLVWLALWSVAAFVAGVVAWIAALLTARVPDPLHRFLAAFVRYGANVYAFLYLVGGPFPGFVGAERSYPIAILIDGPERQSRWTIFFRGLLSFPAMLLALGYGGVLFSAGVLGWFYALAHGRMPRGLRDIGAAAIRYQAQTWSYALLVTPRYPYSAPTLEGAPPELPSGQMAMELPA
jgi:hypothetical protein